MKKMFLIDAYALIFKYYYAFLSFPMRSPDGINTSAIFGFVKFINDLINKHKPDCLGVAFDLSGGTFRNELFPEYKANRQETPEDIVVSAAEIKEILKALNISIVEKRGWEADDIIGTLAKRASSKGNYDVYIVSPDKDLGQLADEHIHIYRPGNGNGKEDQILSADDICMSYGIKRPTQIIDILALWGDAADNIPGVPGIGVKGAGKLLAEWDSVENIISNADKLKPKVSEKIRESVNQIMLSKKLATIVLDVPIEVGCDELSIKKPNYAELSKIYSRLGFRTLLSALPNIQQQEKPQKPVGVSYTMKSLFDDEEDNEVVVQQIVTKIPPLTQFPEPEFVQQENTIISYKSIRDVEHNYKTLASEAEVLSLIDQIKDKGIFAFDTETTSVEPMKSRFVSLSVSLGPFTAFCVRDARLVKLMEEVFSSNKIAKIGHNIKFDILVLKKLFGISVNGKLWDTMIMHYILYPESRHNMDYLATTLLSYQPIAIESLIGKGSSSITMDMVDSVILEEYSAEDADVTFRLFDVLKEKIDSFGKSSLYDDIEEPLINVLVEMEYNGVFIDVKKLESIRQNLVCKVNGLETSIRTLAEEPQLNINSPKQLGVVLFDKLKIDPNPKKTKTKSYKTDEETLLGLVGNHEIVSKILEYRGLKKLLSTYVEALPLLINADTGRIHTSFNQAVTATGRLSSSNPNLQNIPVRNQEGKEIRKAFIAEDQNWKIVSADYSQVELRIMAHLSQDRHLLDAFRSGEDIHAATAAKIFRKNIEDVTSDERRKAKTANFGIIYGISSFGLSESLQMSLREAKQFIEDYYLSFPDVRRYIDNVISDARINGYVTTIFGRHRELPEIKSKNANARKFAERNAVNAPIQGSAADIMKIAMAGVYDAIKQNNLKSRILLQIHDELVLEVPASEMDIIRKILTEKMSGAAKLSVPLDVEIGIGDCWLDAH